jgi:oxygen-dependent protoporphyrinogen oxidase
MLKFPLNVEPDMIHIARHAHAIPQYEKTTGERLEAIERLQNHYPGLILAGNIRNGISMADRIRQGTTIGEEV